MATHRRWMITVPVLAIAAYAAGCAVLAASARRLLYHPVPRNGAPPELDAGA